MSKRNSQETKRAARERLRAEREKQAKKQKLRRQLGVGGAVVAVLAIAAGAGIAITNMSDGGGEGDSSDWSAARKVAAGESKSGPYATYETPANAEGKNGTDIVVGDRGATNTVTLYEDMRCPVCSSFEQANGKTMDGDIKNGKYKVEFVFGAFLDRGQGIEGTGSKNALSALGAALDVSPEAFLEYKNLLYSADVHPEETKDEFADDERLIELAQDVKELKGNKNFEKAVTDGTYDPWAVKMSERFDDAKDVTGTPTLKLNGKKLEADAQGSPPMTPEQYNQLVDKSLKK